MKKIAQVIRTNEESRRTVNIMGKALANKAQFKEVVWALTITDPEKNVCPYIPEQLKYKRKKRGKHIECNLEQEEDAEVVATISGSPTPPMWMVDSARTFNKDCANLSVDDLKKIVLKIHPTARIK